MQLQAHAELYDDTLSCHKPPSNDYSNGKQGRSCHILRSSTSFLEMLDLNLGSLLRRSSDPGSRRQSDTNEAAGLTNNHYFFSGEEGRNKNAPSQPPAGCYSVSESGLAGGEPYNTTMQCYCGQNSCPLCNLLLNLQITNTGID